jgi:hypothetical protein
MNGWRRGGRRIAWWCSVRRADSRSITVTSIYCWANGLQKRYSPRSHTGCYGMIRTATPPASDKTSATWTFCHTVMGSDASEGMRDVQGLCDYVLHTAMAHRVVLAGLQPAVWFARAKPYR